MRSGKANGGLELGGIALAATAGLAWGGQFPVAKTILPTLGAPYMSSIRYLIIACAFAAILLIVEGRRAFRFDGHFMRLAMLGALGFAGFNMLAFLGLAHTRPQNASLIVATMPLLTALVLWARRGVRPSRATLTLLLVALFGIALVISRGQWSFITSGKVGYGDLMVLVGAFCWVIYTMAAAEFPTWSPLRYTTLTAVPGAATVLLITLFATAIGATHAPSATAIANAWWQLGYMAIPAGIVAVLSWNAGVKALGPQNAVLFINLVPITTFAIQVAQGSTFSAVEIAGAALTIGALVLNNLLARRRAKPAVVAPEPALAVKRSA